MTKSVGAGIDAERASGGSMTRPMHSADSDPSNTDSGIDDLGSYLDSLPDPAIAVGQDGLIVDSNSLFLDLSGYGIDQIRHLSVESLVPGELRGAHRTYRSELPLVGASASSGQYPRPHAAAQRRLVVSGRYFTQHGPLQGQADLDRYRARYD